VDYGAWYKPVVHCVIGVDYAALRAVGVWRLSCERVLDLDYSLMSVATPTLLPRRPPFPNCLPQPPKPYPTALPRNDGYPGRMNDRRDLERELAELSAEEEEIEKLVSTGAVVRLA
jgi:hypothetical protein